MASMMSALSHRQTDKFKHDRGSGSIEGVVSVMLFHCQSVPKPIGLIRDGWMVRAKWNGLDGCAVPATKLNEFINKWRS